MYSNGDKLGRTCAFYDTIFSMVWGVVCMKNVRKKAGLYLAVHKVKDRGKIHPTTSHEGSDGKQRYSSNHSLTSALDGGGWLTPRPSRFIPGNETQYPFHRRVGGPQGLSGRVRKIWTLLGLQSTVRYKNRNGRPACRLRHSALELTASFS
jgi:hypothetical protein